MNVLRNSMLLAMIVPLASCGLQRGLGDAGAVQCQSRPSDERVSAALGAAVGNSAEQLQGVEISRDCNTGTVVYQMSGEAFARQRQILATDNGKWFIVNLVGLDVQLTEIR